MRASPTPAPGTARSRPGRPAAALLASLLATALPLGQALAQGQESVTSPSGPQTNQHPAPLSSVSAVTVPNAPVIQPMPVPVAVPETQGKGLLLPGSVRLASPQQLACGDIADGNARARCEGLGQPPAPPHGVVP